MDNKYLLLKLYDIALKSVFRYLPNYPPLNDFPSQAIPTPS